ncbi:hypothetical protein ACET3Z_010418 [Daucus carota]
MFSCSQSWSWFQDGDEDRSWRLLSSEDMIYGYKALKRRKTTRSVRRGHGFSNAETEKVVFNTPEAPTTSNMSSDSEYN